MSIINYLFFILFFVKIANANVDDLKCDVQLNYFDNALAKRESWAIELFDSWTKFQSGITSGNLVDLGHYDQCMRFNHDSGDSNVKTIQGKYCVIYYRAIANASTHETDGIFDWRDVGSVLRERNLRLGGAICLPSSCSTSKIRKYVNETILAAADLVITDDYNQSTFCSTNDSPPFETIDIITIVILSIFFLLLLSSTLYEIFMIQSKQQPHELFSAFSIYKNGKKLFNTERGQSSSIIHCLPGLRTLSMLHIMLGHRYNWTRGFPNINSNDFAPDNIWHTTIWSAIVNIHPIAVDCFLILGGCLLSRSIFVAIEKGKFNIPKMYLHRYMRTTSVLAILILFVLSLFKFMGNGPYFEFTTHGAQIDPCRQYYWSALLHIQNYYNPLGACIGPSWYLSVDYQLVLISPFIMYPAYKFGWKFLWTLPVYIIGIQVYTFVAAMQNGYKPVRLLMPFDVGLQSAKEFYFPTYIRCGPWMTGVVLGYILYKLKNRKVVINKYLNASMWILSIATLAAIVFGIYPLQNFHNPAHQVAHALFFALQRNSWAAAIAWIVFSCEMGYGGIIRKFLELPIWIPLGRMSLSFYLVHGLYFSVHIGSKRFPINFNDFELMHTFAGDIIVTTILASILYLTFEEPILLIENYIYKYVEERKKKDVKSTN